MRSLLVIAFALAACGDDEFNGLPDTPPAPDGTPDTAVTGLVKLTVTADGLPRIGVKVYFQNSDSTLVLASMTDVNGVASAVMEMGGFVTAIDPFPARGLPQGVASPTDLRTFSGVKPGDELVLSRGLAQQGINVTILANPDTTVIPASYLLFGPCIDGSLDITNGAGSGSGSGAVGGLVTLQHCTATTDLTIVVFDGTNTPVRSIHKANVAVAAIIDLTDQVYADVEQVTWAYTSLPATIGSFDVTDVVASVRGPQFMSSNSALVDTGAGITPATPRPVIAGALQITSGRFFGGANGVHNVLEWGPATTAYSRSLAATLLADYTGPATYDITAKQIEWTIDAGGVSPDFVVGSAFFSHDTPAVLAWGWQIAAPIGTPATSLRYPVLPAPDEVFNPIATDTVNIDELISIKIPGGYDAIRETVLSLDDDPTGLPLGIVTGATGTVVFEEMQVNQVRAKQTPRQMLRPFADRLHRAKARRR